jgi:hypothetical protein
MSQKSAMKRTCKWERRSLRRAEAIRRNEKYREKYEKEAKEKGLEGPAASAYVNHKIGIPKSKVDYTPKHSA